MRIFIALLIGVLVISCHDDVLAPDRPCEDSSVPVGSSAQVKRQQYEFSGACFNPNNSNEIAYLRRDNSEEGNITYEIWKYNLATDETVRLHSQARPDQWLRWNKANWILFLGGDGQVWKANENDAIQMTKYNDYHINPEWQPQEDSFIVETARGVGANRNFGLYSFSASDFGYQFFDNNDFNGIMPRISHSGKMIAGTLSTPTSGQRMTIVKNLDDQQVIFNDSLLGETIRFDYGYAWFPDEKRVLWCTIGALYIIDVINKDFTILKEFCDLGSRRYRYADVSSDGKKILITREDHKRLGGKNSGRYYVATNIVIMNADGTGEEVVDLGGE
jgi:hypothetical protein